MKYNPALDGLRAIAVIPVVFYHAIKDLLPGGWLGVDIFFVLSGYLITTILWNELEADKNIRIIRFYVRRALRLMPALYLLVLASLPFAMIMMTDRTIYFENAFMTISYMMNWNRAFAWVPGYGGEFGHTWSLAIEEQFYLIWPFLLIIFTKSKTLFKYLIIFIILGVLVWRFYLVGQGASVERVMNGFDTHCDTIMIGCLLALNEIPAALQIVCVRISGIAIAGIFGLIITTNINHLISASLAIDGVAVCAAVLIVMARSPASSWVGSLLGRAFFVYTGRISYGWYLWHFPMLGIGRVLFPKHSTFVLIALSYGVAAFSYHYVEKPFLRWKRRFKKPVAITA